MKLDMFGPLSEVQRRNPGVSQTNSTIIKPVRTKFSVTGHPSTGLRLLLQGVLLISVVSSLRGQSVSSVSLAWSPDPSANVAGYVMQYGTNSGTYTQAIDVGNVTSATASNLICGKVYYFALSAYSSSGIHSIPSDEISFTVPSGLTSPTITWANPADIVYGTPLTSVQLNATANVPGTLAYTPPLGTRLAAGGSRLLSVTFTPTDTTTYPIVSKTVTVNVLKAPLKITANNQSKVYGAPVPALTSSYTGFVNGDTAASLATPVSLATTATSTSAVGTYPITAAGATSPNYAISFVSGTLTVTAANLVSLAVTPASASVTVGQTQAFVATGKYSDGSTKNLTSTVTWSSSNSAVASVSSGGVATAVKAGTANIVATTSGLNAWALLTTSAPSTSTPGSYANGSLITIPSSGKATPYPSAISVSGLSGTISKLTVTLTNLCHTWPSDVGALLVGPSGQKVVLFANVGGGYKLTNVMLTFDDAATAMLPTGKQIVSGTYKPTNAGTGKVYPSPAPAAPYATVLSAFNSSNPNGTWSLYVVDTAAGDSGAIKGGWSMRIVSSSGVAAHFSQVAGGTLSEPLMGSAQARAVGSAPAAILEPVASAQGETFQIVFSGEIGRSYAIQATTDYSDWVTIGAVTAEHETVSYADANANQHPFRFYRVVSLPSDQPANR